MTNPPEQITVRCPSCSREYRAWWRPSINLGLGEEWTEEEVREASTATCPTCGTKVELGTLVVDGDIWRAARREEER